MLLLALPDKFSVFAADKSVCSLFYFGLPDYSACNSLLLGDMRARTRAISVTDGADHAFILKGFAEASDFTEEQWKYKVYIPPVFSNRKCFRPTNRVGRSRDLRLTLNLF